MADIKIEVTAYSGYRGEESPRSFAFEGDTVDVLAIVEMWFVEEELSRKRKRFFTAKGSDGFLYTLFYDLESMEWFLRGRERRRDEGN
jgi:hypothetical protein